VARIVKSVVSRTLKMADKVTKLSLKASQAH